MGLLEVILGKQNPVAQWAAENSGTLGALGAGIGSGTNLGQGLSNAAQNIPQGKLYDQKAAAQRKADALAETQLNATKTWLQKNRPDLTPMLDMGMSPAQVWEYAHQPQQGEGTNALAQNIQTRQTYGQQLGLTGEDLTRYTLTGELPGGNQSVRASVGQPVPMRNRKTGEWAPFAPMSDGTMLNQLTQQPANPDEWAFDPAGAAGAKAGAVADDKTAAAARAALPSAELNFDIATKAADALLSDKAGMDQQFGSILGYPQQWTGAFPGTAKANFRNQLDQLTGQAFLNIRQALKGAGAVTDYEGQRGEVAISRAQAAAEKGDQKAFEAAVIEFKDAIGKGLELLRQQAQGTFAAGTYSSAPPSAQPSGSVEDLVNKYLQGQ